MQIKLTPDNKIRLEFGLQGIEFTPELGAEVIHGITIAMSEAGRREIEQPGRIHPYTTILEIDDDDDDG